VRIPSEPETIDLDTDDAFVATILRGAGIRVIDRRIETTTSGSREDVWLREGEEHCLPNHGPAVSQRQLEQQPPTGRYQGSVPRAVCGIAALAMTAVTIALLVILPAQMQFGNHQPRAPVASKASTATSTERAFGQRIPQPPRARLSTGERVLPALEVRPSRVS